MTKRKVGIPREFGSEKHGVVRKSDSERGWDT